MQESLTQLVDRLRRLFADHADRLDPGFAAEAGGIVAQLVERTSADVLAGATVPALAATPVARRAEFVARWVEPSAAEPPAEERPHFD